VQFMRHFKGGACYKCLGTSGIVSDYRLGDRASIPGRGKEFSSSLSVQTTSKSLSHGYQG
jgi:hypothetical protein